MMKLQDVLSKARAKKIGWVDAREIIGGTDRFLRCWRERLEGHGYGGLVSKISICFKWQSLFNSLER